MANNVSDAEHFLQSEVVDAEGYLQMKRAELFRLQNNLVQGIEGVETKDDGRPAPGHSKQNRDDSSPHVVRPVARHTSNENIPERYEGALSAFHNEDGSPPPSPEGLGPNEIIKYGKPYYTGSLTGIHDEDGTMPDDTLPPAPGKYRQNQ